MATFQTPPRLLRFTVVAAVFSFAATLALPLLSSPAEHVGVNAERGDPARWYVPADTPALKYETQVKEARAALGEAQKECRAQQGGRSDCFAMAQAQYRQDMADARRLLENGKVGGK